ncbi:glycosyltransferase family 4 protein [Thalassospira profundimaris]|nr:glycosyltransferase family 4 protein [Thalassospira profundimaris]
MSISVLFVCRNFHRMAGGVERMATAMMNEMVKRGFKVGLLTWDEKNAEAHYDLAPQIEWMQLDMGHPDKAAGWRLRLRRQIRIRSLIKNFKPDVTIAFQVGAFIATKTALLGTKIPIIAAERNSPDLFDHIQHGKRLRRRSNLFLATSDCITVQLESYRMKYPAFLRKRIVSIPNPVWQPLKSPHINSQAAPKQLILSMGRLSYQKNQTFLLRAFALIANKNPDWTLALVGDGEAASELRKLADELKLTDQVIFAGSVKNVSDWYEKSAFLAFPSLWEGFPNALVEALSHGIPAIGLQSTSGVNELLQDGYNGLLVTSTEAAFADAMQRMIVSPDMLQDMGKMAIESVKNYEASHIFDRWQKLFTDLAKRPK